MRQTKVETAPGWLFLILFFAVGFGEGTLAHPECGPVEGVGQVDTIYDPSDRVHTGEDTHYYN